MILLSLLLMPTHLTGSHQELRSEGLSILPLLIIGMRVPLRKRSKVLNVIKASKAANAYCIAAATLGTNVPYVIEITLCCLIFQCQYRVVSIIG